MFSSQQLICYVFANPDDEYRGSDLMTLNLNQYLWQSLHRQYNTVYFLSSPDQNTVTVRNFGDRNAKNYKPSFFGFSEKGFGNWLCDQMERPDDRAAAIVCDLDVFCQVFSRTEWKPWLERIALNPKRTGIFVLTASPYAEDSLSYFLESPVFDYLRETAVTESRSLKRCIYDSIREEKPRHYRCLNAFTQERISDLMLHLSMANPERCLDSRERETIAANLAANLNSGDPLPGILESSQPTAYLTYRELYRLLRDRSAWEKVLRLSQSTCAKIPPILRSPQCYAGKCLKLQLPDWVIGRVDSNMKSPEVTLKRIREIAAVPPNSLENQEFVDIACGFLEKLRNLEAGDIDTYSLLLDGLKDCIEWITVCEGDINYQNIQDILKLYTFYATSSSDLYRREMYLTERESDPSAPSIERLRLPELWKQLERDKYDHNDCVGYLYANITAMKGCSLTSGQVSENLRKEIRKAESPCRIYQTQ